MRLTPVANDFWLTEDALAETFTSRRVVLLLLSNAALRRLSANEPSAVAVANCDSTAATSSVVTRSSVMLTPHNTVLVFPVAADSEMRCRRRPRTSLVLPPPMDQETAAT